MKGVSNLELLASFGNSRKSSGNGLFRITEEDGTVTFQRGAASSSQIGKFEGKSGGMVRSAKGATRRKLDGRRYYVPGADSPYPLVAYKAATVVK